MINIYSTSEMQTILTARDIVREQAPASVRYLLDKGKERPDIVATRQGFMGMDVSDFPPTGFGACTSTTGTLLWNDATTVPLTTWTAIPAMDARAGKAYKVSFGGIIGTSSSAPTTVWTPAWGVSATLASNVSLGASNAATATASLSSGNFYGEFTVGIRSLGIHATQATAMGSGFVAYGGVTTTAAQVATMGATAATVDTMAASGLGVWLTYGTAQASNTATCNWVVLQSLN